jgi:type III secretion protein U
MAKKEKGASQTEQPTRKRLKDARKEGEVHKSRELTSTVLILLWLVMGWLLTPVIYHRLEGLFELTLKAFDTPFYVTVFDIGVAAAEAMLLISLMLLLPAALIGTFTTYLQVGPVFAPKRLKPNAAHVNPAEGIKRMFSQKNLVEVSKAVVKTILLFAIFVFVLLTMLGDFLRLPFAEPGLIGTGYWKSTVLIGSGVVLIFFFISVLDALYQRHVFIKELRMSRRDIRQELKDSEGDPHIRSQRKQLHKEWAEQNMLQAVRDSSVVVTNPTHIAVALYYEANESKLPTVTAKGEGLNAEAIKQTAREAGVPIVENVKLARGLHEKIDVDDYVTAEFFTAVAEVLRWAESVTKARPRL